MANFDFNGRSIYYEEHGTGEPLIILNGIFMSCASWMGFIPAFSAQFRLVLVDFLDQGRSGKMDADYTQQVQVEVVNALYKHLNIEEAHILGISYGGEVGMQFASAYPNKVIKLVLANTAANTCNWLKDIGKAWEYSYSSRDGRHFFKACIPVIYSPEFYNARQDSMKAREDMFVNLFTPDVYDAFGRLTRSAESHDARAVLGSITAKTLVISSEYDFLTPPYQQAELAAGIPDSYRIILPNAGHAAMYEKPGEFTAAVIGFLLMQNPPPGI